MISLRLVLRSKTLSATRVPLSFRPSRAVRPFFLFPFQSHARRDVYLSPVVVSRDSCLISKLRFFVCPASPSARLECYFFSRFSTSSTSHDFLLFSYTTFPPEISPPVVRDESERPLPLFVFSQEITHPPLKEPVTANSTPGILLPFKQQSSAFPFLFDEGVNVPFTRDSGENLLILSASGRRTPVFFRAGHPLFFSESYGAYLKSLSYAPSGSFRLDFFNSELFLLLNTGTGLTWRLFLGEFLP